MIADDCLDMDALHRREIMQMGLVSQWRVEGEARGTSRSVQFFFTFSCSFRQNLSQIIG